MNWINSVIVPTPSESWGGSSFVEFVTAINLSFLGLSELRRWLKSAWGRFSTKYDEQIKKINDRSREVDPQLDRPDLTKEALQKINRAKEDLDRLRVFMEQDVRKRRDSVERKIERLSILLAWIALCCGFFCLFFNCYSPASVLLLLPWPLCWVATEIAYRNLWRDIQRNIDFHIKVTLYEPTTGDVDARLAAEEPPRKAVDQQFDRLSE